MCLILTAYKKHPQYKLIVLANRDEFYKRSSAQANWWTNQDSLLAGKDLVGGGTWLGINRKGEFAALTNYRDPAMFKKVAPTRGSLVTDYLLSDQNAADYLQGLQADAASYNGYNLIMTSGSDLYYYSNIENKVKLLDAGVYGLCNHLLDTPWPKVERARFSFNNLLSSTFSPEEAFKLMQDEHQPADDDLPSTGVSMEWERAVSSIYIDAAGYGTRCSTLILIDHNNQVYFEERSYVPKAKAQQFFFVAEETPIV